MTCAKVTHPLDEPLAHVADGNKESAGSQASLGPPAGPCWYRASGLLAEEGTLKELLGLFSRYMKTERPFLQAALFMP